MDVGRQILILSIYYLILFYAVIPFVHSFFSFNSFYTYLAIDGVLVLLPLYLIFKASLLDIYSYISTINSYLKYYLNPSSRKKKKS